MVNVLYRKRSGNENGIHPEIQILLTEDLSYIDPENKIQKFGKSLRYQKLTL